MTQMSRIIVAGALAAVAVAGTGRWAVAQDANPLIAAEERKMSEAEIAKCQKHFGIDPKNHTPTKPVTSSTTCRSDLKKNGFPVPDPACTPGAVNETVQLADLKSPDFKTGCVRDQATSEDEKKTTYKAYDLKDPPDNQGKNQTCELDHLISLELGGADTLDNIWPQCGPADAELDNRFFKEKDTVENYLAFMVKSGQMKLADAQKGIATDWTQFLDKARAKCPKGNCPKGGGH